MYKPVFPYLGNQAIISSGRVVIHSSDDFIFHFGKKGVAISSPATFTVDANEKTTIASPIIELGYQAKQQVLRGNATATQLGFVLDQLESLGDILSNMLEVEAEVTITKLNKLGIVMKETAKTVKANLNTECLSKTTLTL